MDIPGEELGAEPELILLARQGDAAAWEALVAAHQEAVFRLAYLFLADADEAADAAQDTFLRAYDALARFDIARPLRPWLLSIAANLARNRRRAAGRYLAALKRLVGAEPPHSPGVEARGDRRMDAQALWQAVRRLSSDDQQVIYLRFFLDLTTEEAAESLGVAAGTVKSRLHRALARLRSLIQSDFPGLEEGWDV